MLPDGIFLAATRNLAIILKNVSTRQEIWYLLSTSKLNKVYVVPSFSWKGKGRLYCILYPTAVAYGSLHCTAGTVGTTVSYGIAHPWYSPIARGTPR